MRRSVLPTLRPLLAALLLLLGGGGPGVAREAAEATVDPSRLVCERAIATVERESGLPEGLLQAIALAESGRYDRQRKTGYAWPWTVTSGGAGRYLDDQPAALAEVARLRAAGRTNIDVGCMQVNLHFHGHAFASVAAATDPVTNARYAATFLKSLYAETGDWETAVAWYHSRTPARGRGYRERVYARWEGLRRDGPAGEPSEPELALAAVAAAGGPVAGWSRRLFGWFASPRPTEAALIFAAPPRSLVPVAAGTSQPAVGPTLRPASGPAGSIHGSALFAARVPQPLGVPGRPPAPPPNGSPRLAPAAANASSERGHREIQPAP